jgi:hypothetical protein
MVRLNSSSLPLWERTGSRCPLDEYRRSLYVAAISRTCIAGREQALYKMRRTSGS